MSNSPLSDAQLDAEAEALVADPTAALRPCGCARTFGHDHPTECICAAARFGRDTNEAAEELRHLLAIDQAGREEQDLLDAALDFERRRPLSDAQPHQEGRMTDQPARLRVDLDAEPHFSRVEWVEGTGKLLPCSQVEVRQSPDPKGQNCVVLHVPLDFIDLSLVQRRRP